MRDCHLAQSGDRLTIHPTGLTLLFPLLACGYFALVLGVGGLKLLKLAPADAVHSLTGADTWWEAPVVVGAFGTAVVWYLMAAGPVVLDRQAGELVLGGRRQSLAGARAVTVEVEEFPDAPDRYHVEIVLLGRRLRVGRWGWGATDPAQAERNARIVADFLDLPVD